MSELQRRTSQFAVPEQWATLADELMDIDAFDQAVTVLYQGALRFPGNQQIHRGMRKLSERIEACVVRRTCALVPPILYVSQPQTASNFIEQELARRLGIFIGHEGLTNEEFHQAGTINPDRLSRFLSIGGIIREHLAPTEANLTLLRFCGIKKILVTVRDPRQSVFSEVRFAQRLGAGVLSAAPNLDAISLLRQMPEGFFSMPDREAIIAYYKHRLPFVVSFIRGWAGVANHPEIGTRVHIARYEDFKVDYDRFFGGILDFYQIPRELWRGARGDSAPGQHAFRKGSVDEWRSELSADIQAMVNEMVPDDLLARFGWRR